MPAVTKYANTITQTTGGKYQPFSNLNNLKNANNTFAKSTNRITGKKGAKPTPSTITCTNFGFNLPVGAEVTSVLVEFGQQKIDYTKGKYPSLPAPELTILASNIPARIKATNAPPTKNMVRVSKTYNGKSTPNYNLPTREQVNNSKFGVKLTYFANKNDYQGWLQLKYIRITVNYKTADFNLILERVTNESLIVGETTDLHVTLTNANRVKYKDTVVITLPSCLSINNISVSQGIKVNGNTITWTPNQPYSSQGFIITVFCEHQGDGEVTAITQLQKRSKKLSFTVNPRPTKTVSVEEFDSETIINTRVNQTFTLPIQIPAGYPEGSIAKIRFTNPVRLYDDTELEANEVFELTLFEPSEETSSFNLPCACLSEGVTGVYVGLDDMVPEKASFILQAVPENFQYPSIAIYKLEEEELNRLGDGFTYTIHSMLKLNSEIVDMDEFIDFYRNFRLGVFNENIPEDTTITSEYLFDNCKHWSSLISVFNEFEDKEVQFTYNIENPVYIIFTGEYITTNPTDFSLEYTEPILVESSIYQGYEKSGNFPIPILNTLEADVPSEINVNSFEESNSIVFYDFPFENTLDSSYAIRGIEISADITADSRVAALFKLKNEFGESKEKSVIVSPETGKISVGGQYDAWGFKVSELKNAPDFEFELQFENLFSSENGLSEISLNNVQITFYYFEIPMSVSYFLVDGEDCRLYGAFLEDAKIPFGLDTDTKFLDVDGTDLNDAYRMNIDKKEIELELNLYGCTLEESTQQLKEIAKLFVNKRDKLNRPIPKIIQFNFLPGEHFEFVMTDAIDPNIESTDYNPKIKLVVPDGTSYANEDTVATYTGTVSGIAKVSPIIQLVPLSSTVLITENEGVDEQSFLISYSGLDSNKLVEIDCINRRVLLKNSESDTSPEDITQYADYNVDWFKLHGDFLFETNNTCIIQTVTFNERG